MNEATIKQLQTELVDTDAEIADLDKKEERLDDQLEGVLSASAVARGNRTALRRLLKQNDALHGDNMTETPDTPVEDQDELLRDKEPDIRFFTPGRQIVIDDFPGFVDAAANAVEALATVSTALQAAVDYLKVEDSQ